MQVGKTDGWADTDLAGPEKLRPKAAAGKDKKRPDGASENQGCLPGAFQSVGEERAETGEPSGSLRGS